MTPGASVSSRVVPIVLARRGSTPWAFTTAGQSGEFIQEDPMTVESRTMGPALQRNAEDAAALISERRQADRRESDLLANAKRLLDGPLTPLGANALRRTIDELLAMDGAENPAHDEIGGILRTMAGELERANREEWELGNKKAPDLFTADPEQGKEDEANRTTHLVQLSLFGVEL